MPTLHEPSLAAIKTGSTIRYRIGRAQWFEIIVEPLNDADEAALSRIAGVADVKSEENLGVDAVLKNLLAL